MSVIDVFISLKITDNTARSALYALQNRMGMPFIKALKRWDVWELELAASSNESEGCVKDWVENTALFMNPNKHIYKMQPANTPILDTNNPPLFCQTQGSIFVYDREDGHSESVLQSLQKTQENGRKVMSLMHGVWWDITFDDTVTDSSKYIKELAKTTHRTSGLFSNPHYQDVKLFFPEQMQGAYMQIRTVPEEDFSSVRHLLEQAFPDVSRSFFHAISQYDPWYNEKFSLAVEVGNKLVSFLQIFDRTVMIDGKHIRFGGIGSVGTHPNHTQKGYASALLNHAVQVMQQEGMAGGVLFTKIHPFYEKLGWQTLNLNEQIFQVNDLKFRTGNGYSSRPLRDNDIETLHNIYEKEQSKYAGTIVRNLPYWKKRPHWMSHPCRVLLQQDKVIGYYYTAKYRENIPMLHIIEYGFHTPDEEVINAFFEDVHKVAQENFCTSICANFQVHPQLNKFIQIQNIQSAQQPYSYMMWKNIGIHNFHERINQLAKENSFTYWQTDAF